MRNEKGKEEGGSVSSVGRHAKEKSRMISLACPTFSVSRE